MKIQENDLLWRWYLRYYKYEKEIPEPKSLCPYFWSAMGGLVTIIVVDLALYITLPVALAALVGYVYLIGSIDYFRYTKNDLVAISIVIPGLILMIGCLILVVGKFVAWMERSVRRTKWVVSILLTTCIVLLVYSVFTAKPQPNPNWKEELIKGLIAIGVGWGIVMGGIALYYLVFRPASLTRLGQQVIAFFKGVKRGVCPLVDPPDSFKDRWKHTGDG